MLPIIELKKTKEELKFFLNNTSATLGEVQLIYDMLDLYVHSNNVNDYQIKSIMTKLQLLECNLRESLINN